MSTCEHRHILLSLSLANTSWERQGEERDTALPFLLSLPLLSFFLIQSSFPFLREGNVTVRVERRADEQQSREENKKGR